MGPLMICNCKASNTGDLKDPMGLPYFTRGGADLPQPRANVYTHKKSMGGYDVVSDIVHNAVAMC